MGTLAVVAQVFNRRVETARVNRVIQDAIARHHPPSPKGRALKIYYATQVGRRPPTFVIKVNNPELCHFSYERYLRNRLREELGLVGTPIHIRLEGRSARGER